MTTRQPGLRVRLELEGRRISSQHRRLDALFEALCEALGADEPAAVRAACGSFRESLEAHFGVEERTEFPALHGLAPETEATIVGLVADHEHFRTELAGLETRLAGADAPVGAQELEALGRALSEHETREERLFEASTKDRRPKP